MHFVTSQADTSFGQEAEYSVQQLPLNFTHKSFIFKCVPSLFQEVSLFRGDTQWVIK